MSDDETVCGYVTRFFEDAKKPNPNTKPFTRNEALASCDRRVQRQVIWDSEELCKSTTTDMAQKLITDTEAFLAARTPHRAPTRQLNTFAPPSGDAPKRVGAPLVQQGKRQRAGLNEQWTRELGDDLTHDSSLTPGQFPMPVRHPYDPSVGFHPTQPGHASAFYPARVLGYGQTPDRGVVQSVERGSEIMSSGGAKRSSQPSQTPTRFESLVSTSSEEMLPENEQLPLVVLVPAADGLREEPNIPSELLAFLEDSIYQAIRGSAKIKAFKKLQQKQTTDACVLVTCISRVSSKWTPPHLRVMACKACTAALAESQSGRKPTPRPCGLVRSDSILILPLPEAERVGLTWEMNGFWVNRASR